MITQKTQTERIKELIDNFQAEHLAKLCKFINRYKEIMDDKRITCNSCSQYRKEYVTGLCKKCAKKMDKHLEKKQ